MRGEKHLRLRFYPRSRAVEFHKAWIEHCRQRDAYYELSVVEEGPPPQLAAGSARPALPVSATGNTGDSSVAPVPPALAGRVAPESSTQQHYLHSLSDVSGVAGDSAVDAEVAGTGKPSNSVENTRTCVEAVSSASDVGECLSAFPVPPAAPEENTDLNAKV